MKMKYLYHISLLALIGLIFTACATIQVEPRKYFILEYKSVHEDPELFSRTPHNFTIRVLDAEVNGTYNRRQLVIRTSENQIMYDNENLWADRLPQSLSNLMHQRISVYNIYSRVTRSYQQQAKYEIATSVNALEFLNYGSVYGARLNIEMLLRRVSDNQVVFQHASDRNKQLHSDDVEMFVQTINDLLMEETDIFLKALNRYIDRIESGAVYEGRDFFTSRRFVADSLRTVYRLELEEIEEGENINFMGRLFVPSLTDPEYEPLFSIEDSNENYIGSYPMGSDVYLIPGLYHVHLGNGTIGQKVVEKVEVFSRYKTLLEPNVGWLTINIIDNSRNQIDQRYELHNLSNAESYGFGYGIKEGVGQQLETWILKPGHYKIVLNGMPFNTFFDFATVEVKKGELEQFTIVVDESTKRLIGAGRMFHEDMDAIRGRLKVSIFNHFNATFNSRNETAKNVNTSSLTAIEQLDSQLVYDSPPYHYTLKNLIEIGVSKESDTDFRISSDKFDLKNTFVYFFFKNLGLYARADLSTHMFDEYNQTKERKNYKRIDRNGNETTEYTNKFKTKNAFFPVVLKEGVGINYRVLNKNRANLNLRAGLGFRQDLNSNVFGFEKTDSGYDIYRELDDISQRGTEFSANGNFQIFRDLNYTTNADLLIPFHKDDTEIFEWENIINLRMFKYMSWDYRLNLSYNKNIRDYILVDHALFLRLTYIFVN